jgi:diacylglycerol kinase family enzyme
VFVAPECGRFEILALPMRAVANRLGGAEKFVQFQAEEVSIDIPAARVRVALDGEVAVMRPPLRYRIRSAALRVILPEAPPAK